MFLAELAVQRGDNVFAKECASEARRNASIGGSVHRYMNVINHLDRVGVDTD